MLECRAVWRLQLKSFVNPVSKVLAMAGATRADVVSPREWGTDTLSSATPELGGCPATPPAKTPEYWETESYRYQTRAVWPRQGRHILAQFTDDTVVVYQAYKPEIAEYAVKNQKFGGPHFSYERMTWIKTNFLWMMYRCGWCTKKNQERVLAVRITRKGFETILANAYSVALQKSQELKSDQIQVRLQWDPDHGPTYEKLERRAIQLGLKGEIVQKYGKEWIVDIEDITEFVKEQYKLVKSDKMDELIVARERVYPINDTELAHRIHLDFYKEDPHPTVVVHPKKTSGASTTTDLVQNKSQDEK